MRRRIIALAYFSLLMFCFFSLAPHTQGAGVTVVTHGWTWDSENLNWVESMTQRIKDRFGSADYTLYPITVYNIVGIGLSYSIGPRSGVDPTTSSSGEIILLIDWRDVANWDWLMTPTSDIARVLDNLFYDNQISELDRPLAELPIHVIGHSRGGALVTQLADCLGRRGIWVNQVSTLDLHPIDTVDNFDFFVNLHENVLFADSYWQVDPWGLNGEPLDGAYSRELLDSVLADGGYEGPHSDIHLWYHGTIDLNTPASDGNTNITETMRQNWWQTWEEQGAKTGYRYSRIEGGTYSGGTRPGSGMFSVGHREPWDLNVSGAEVWDNIEIVDFETDKTVTQGGSFQLCAPFRDENQDAQIMIGLDTDRNPYNGVSGSALLTRNTSEISDTLLDINLSTSGRDPNTYYVYTKISNETHTRYYYAKGKLIVTAPGPQPTAISLTCNVSDSPVAPNYSITISGTANYNNSGGPVPAGVVNITVNGQTNTASISGGNYSRAISAPSLPNTYTVACNALDGLGRSGSASGSVTVQIGGTSGYTIKEFQTYRNEIDDGVNVFGLRDGGIPWVVGFENVTGQHNCSIYVYFPDRDGELGEINYGNYLPAEDLWEYPDDFTAHSFPGQWRLELIVDGSLKRSFPFTSLYDFKEHRMCNDHQPSDPYDPVNETYTFKQTDQKAETWCKLEKVTDPMEMKWIFYEPSGSQYSETTYTSTDPQSEGYDYWDWYKFWGNIGIQGHSAANKCGDWSVGVFIKDFQGNWAQKYTDHFRIIEDPAQEPSCSVSATPAYPVETQTVTLNVLASDNTYLKSVTLYWDDGSQHSETWNNIFVASLNQTKDIGTYSSGQQVTYWAIAMDTSGNSFESAHKTIVYSQNIILAPQNVQASDGTYSDKVRVTWNVSSMATSYEVWRNTSDNSGSATRLSNDPTATTYDDTSSVVGTNYYYWIKAKNANATSDFSSSDSGYCQVTTYYVSPTGNNASIGTNWDTAKLTIQAAIDTTSAGDTILVDQGIYCENLVMNKAVTLTSRAPNDSNVVANTIIDGGGVASVIEYMSGGPAVIRGFTIRNGHASNYGGAIDVNGGLGGYNLTIENNIISSNKADGSGGSIYAFIVCPVIRSNTFQFNDASNLGGVIYARGVTNLCLTDNQFFMNSAHRGGAICLDYNGVVTIDKCAFVSNTCPDGGSAIRVDDASLSVANSIFSGNAGGGSIDVSGGPAIIINSIFMRNRGAFPGVWARNNTSIQNCTFFDNESFIYAGAVRVENGPCVINNSIVASNRCAGIEVAGGSCGITNCNVFGNKYNYSGISDQTGIYGNIGLDPLFIDAPIGNLHLSSMSPCIDAGTNQNWMTDATDFDGNQRIVNTRVDIGAYEFVFTLSAGTFQFSLSSASINENAGSVTLIVTRSGGSSGAASVNYATQNGTAAAGTDYTATSGTLNWASGNADSKTITVPIINRSGTQGSRTFTVTLSGASGASLGSPNSATVMITDGGSVPSGFALIPAGSYTMGDSFGDGYPEELPTHSVSISAFYMEEIEVTKSQWDEVSLWATSHGYSFVAGLGKAFDHPVCAVNWYNAVKWCNARSEKDGLTPCYYTTSAQTTIYKTGDTDISSGCVNWSANGYRLPTEAEWEKAASGGVSGHRFPWSDANTISHDRANFYNGGGESYVTGTTGYHPTYSTGGSPYTSPGGSFAANGYGLYDMAGNVWELCWDWWSSSYYLSSPSSDPRGASSGSYRVLRGGGWDVIANYCRTSFRSLVNPVGGSGSIGFRCAIGSGGGETAFTISGTVYYSTNPLPNCPVRLWDLDCECLAATTSDISGRYSFSVTNGNYYVVGNSVEYPGSVDIEVTVSDKNVSHDVYVAKDITPLYPTDVATVDVVSPLFSWQTIPEATQYHFQVNVLSNWFLVESTSGLTDSYYQSDIVLSNNERYVWGAHAYDAFGHCVGYTYNSTLWMFTVNLTLFPPTGVSASDGTYTDKVRVTWNSSSGASGYKIWRGTGGNVGTASFVGEATGTTFDDTVAAVSVSYHYWARSSNSHGTSGFSSPDTGYRAGTVPPSAPTGVSASDGTFTDKVCITWNAVADAIGYEVWRYTSDSSGSASKISSLDPTGTSYDDIGATAGTTYYYWLKSKNTTQTSGFSSSDFGYWVETVPPNILPAPTGVSASDGMYSDKVQVIWNAVSEATSYEVWRSTTNDSGAAGKLADVALSLTAEERESLTLRDTENQLVLAPRSASPAYDDTSAFAKVTYYYWVKTKRASDVSEFSQSDSGYRKAGLPPPASVVASDGTYSNKVRIVWPIVTGATSYEVWRAAVNAAGFAALLGEVGGLEGNDTTAQLGTVYYYWVKSKNALKTSAFSLSDSGYCSREVNIQPKVTINGASGEVALRKGDTLSVAILLMATSGLNADWWVVIAIPGGAWYYFDAYTGGWNPITGEFTPTYQGTLFDFLAPIEILNMSTTWLPTGAYVFYFGVDTAMNGDLDLPPVLVFDSTTMTLTE